MVERNKPLHRQKFVNQYLKTLFLAKICNKYLYCCIFFNLFLFFTLTFIILSIDFRMYHQVYRHPTVRAMLNGFLNSEEKCVDKICVAYSYSNQTQKIRVDSYFSRQFVFIFSI